MKSETCENLIRCVILCTVILVSTSSLGQRKGVLTNRNYVVKKNYRNHRKPRNCKIKQIRQNVYHTHEKLYEWYGGTAKPAEEATNARLASVSIVDWVIFLHTKWKERCLGKIWQLYRPKLRVNRGHPVRCAMLCQQPFIPHDTTSQETSREGILQHCVKTHKPKEQDREERKVLRKTNGRVHARPLKVAGTSSVWCHTVLSESVKYVSQYGSGV